MFLYLPPNSCHDKVFRKEWLRDLGAETKGDRRVQGTQQPDTTERHTAGLRG